MCWWCGASDCRDGEKCHHAQSRNTLLNSNTYRSANRRIERVTVQRVARAPGVPWDGRRPAFVPGIRNTVMGGAGGNCSICGTPITGTVHVDHKIPWRTYTEQSARTAMQELGQSWTGGPIPDDFVRVMSSDPKNLQAAHAHCNESKSDSLPGRPAGAARRENREAQRQEDEYQREAERRRISQQQADRDERARRRNRRRDGHDPD